MARGEEIYLTASWYSVESLHKDGQWKITKGVMANGNRFSDINYTCATWLYPLGTILRVDNRSNGKSILVVVTDRINRRFAKTRIDLSPIAFKTLAGRKGLAKGLIKVLVERIK